jgi:hypothetical protein
MKVANQEVGKGKITLDFKKYIYLQSFRLDSLSLQPKNIFIIQNLNQ